MMRDDHVAKSLTLRASSLHSPLPLSSSSPAPVARSEAAFSAHQIAHVVRRRKALIILSAFFMLGLAIAAWGILTPKYESVATLEINKEDTDALGLDTVSAASAAGSGALEFNITMGTHAKALETDSVALQVIQQLRLDQRPEFQWKPSSFDLLKTKSESDRPLENAPHKRASMLKTFHRLLKVDAITGTRLIEVRFKDPEPQIAADVANAVANDYIEQNFRTRYTATAQVSDWLSRQLEQLKDQMTASDQKLVDYETKTGILGTDGATDVVVSKLEDLNKKLTEAEDNRITRQAIFELVKSGNAELVSGLAGNSSSGTGLTGQNPLENLQHLRQQQAEINLRYAEAAKKFGPAYPKLAEVDSQLRMLDSEIHTELEKVAKRAENDFLAAQSAETKLRSLFAQQKAEANRLNDKAVQLSLLKQEAESNRELYDDLQRKLKSAVVLSGLRSTNMVVVDPARPSVDPVRPLTFFLALGTVSGLLAGVALAFGKEALDTTVWNP
ncbi:MAG: Protein-tyrosine kinase, partial [Candidatus Acidoferrum typicum]|nr:Protein-tyrosine kinase [Candidatus Acidoferrum typicum]